MLQGQSQSNSHLLPASDGDLAPVLLLDKSFRVCKQSPSSQQPQN